MTSQRADYTKLILSKRYIEHLSPDKQLRVDSSIERPLMNNLLPRLKKKVLCT